MGTFNTACLIKPLLRGSVPRSQKEVWMLIRKPGGELDPPRSVPCWQMLAYATVTGVVSPVRCQLSLD